MTKPIIILGGGTFNHVRNHLSIAAPAFGTTARWLHQALPNSELLLTRMADSRSRIETNADVEAAIQNYLSDTGVKCLVMNAAMCDYDGTIGALESGKHALRLKSRKGQQMMALTPSKKIIATIKNQRPDMFLVGFKTTTEHSPAEQTEAALRMGQGSRCDLIFANDTVTRNNMLITTDGTCLVSSEDRQLVLERLVQQVRELEF